VQEGDNLSSIAEQFNLGNQGIPFLLMLNPSLDPCEPLILVGQELTIPNPDLPFPTATPVSLEISPATKTTYVIQPGDNLDAIAALFHSTVEDIMEENEIEDQNQIFAGQCIEVRMNLVIPTATPVAGATAAATASSTP
jgi:LysM repeat protein